MSWQAEMQGLAQKLGDKLTPRDVLEFARDPSTALHEKIEWDDAVAGDEFRIIQARGLIRRVVVKFDRGLGNKPMAVRAFLNVERGTSEYRGIAVVRGNPEATAAVIQQIMLDLRSVERRVRIYAAALEAAPDLLTQIDAFLSANQQERAAS